MHLHEISALVMKTSDPSFAVDRHGCIAAWNDAAEAMFAISATSAVGRQCNEVVRGTDECGLVCSDHCAIQQAVQKHQPVGNFDLQVQTPKGMLWCNISVLIADGAKVATPYAIHIVRQIDRYKRFEIVMRDFVVADTQRSAEKPTASNSSNVMAARKTILSERERDILKLLASGVTTTAAANQLHISRTTVNNHVQHILKKLGSHTRLEAIRRAERAGLI